MEGAGCALASAALKRPPLFVLSLRDSRGVGSCWLVLPRYPIGAIDLAGHAATRCLISGSDFCVLVVSTLPNADAISRRNFCAPVLIAGGLIRELGPKPLTFAVQEAASKSDKIRKTVHPWSKRCVLPEYSP